MAERIVVDTDVVSYAYKGDARFARFAAALERKELVVSFVTVAELHLWTLTRNWGATRRDNLLQTVRQNYLMFGVDEELCRLWAELRQAGSVAGRLLPEHDAWIAATAIRLDAALATNNRRHFENVANLRLA